MSASNVRSPGAHALADLMRTARRRLDDVAQVGAMPMPEGAMPMPEAASVILEQCDAISVQVTGARLSPDRLRDLANQAETMAAEYRRIASERERDVS